MLKDLTVYLIEFKILKKKIALIEDVCESYGAKFKNKKLGTYGLISTSHFITLIIYQQLKEG